MSTFLKAIHGIFIPMVLPSSKLCLYNEFRTSLNVTQEKVIRCIFDCFDPNYITMP